MFQEAIASEQLLEPQYSQETYSRSMATNYRVGELACFYALEAPEVQGVLQEAYSDFESSVEEDLTTDKEYSDKLKFNPMRERPIVDGHVVSKEGRWIADLVAVGLASAKQAAISDPEMIVEVERAEGDEEVVAIVDSLEVGEMYAVGSVEPKEALARNQKYWHRKNYREGMAIVQVYWRKDENTMLAGSFSIKNSSMLALKSIFASHGVEVPEDETANRFIRHGIRQKASEVEARSFGPQLQEDHKQAVNKTHEDISVTELIEKNQKVIKEYFYNYIVPLSEALYTGKNNQVMQSLASTLINKAKNPEDRHQFLRIANSQKFTRDNADFMEEKIRYALDEELREKLVRLVNGDASSTPEIDMTTNFARNDIVIVQTNSEAQMIMNQRLANNVARGESAGRSYGGLGCSGTGKSRNQLSDDDFEGADSQYEFGGKDKRKDDEESNTNTECCYSGTFCYCCPYNVDGTPAPKPFVITARRGKDGVARCLRKNCGATLDASGKADKGGIYERAMQLQTMKRAS